ncbi:MAG: CDP-alcohol phosphatidyltransferase family protein [Ardenticatenaceae bacterium]|nr:CDP-alcohol phosphatidyltransferase family protein [Ardenticatenaceae bacterium]
MLDPSARIAKERVLTPLAALLSNVNPNVVTLISLFLGLVSVYAAWQGYYVVALVFWALNRLTDGLDGTMARNHEKQSDLGGYFDILGDFVVYSFLPVALVLSMPTSINFIALAVLLSIYYINTASWMYLGAILEKRMAGAAARGEMTTVSMPGGLIGGTETILFYGLFLLFPSLLAWLYFVFAGLIVFTVIQRLIWAIKHLQ